MPIYEMKCKGCGKTLERICKLDEIVHCTCGDVMERLMPSAVGINMGVGAYGYYDDNLQSYVPTNKARRKEMKKQGVSEAFGKGWY